MKKYVYYYYFHFSKKNGTHVLAMFVGTVFSQDNVFSILYASSNLCWSNISSSCALYVGIDVCFSFILAICKIFCYFVFQATLKIEKIDFLSSSICIFFPPSLISRNLFGYSNITCNIFSFSSLCLLLFLVDFIHYLVTRCYGYIVVSFLAILHLCLFVQHLEKIMRLLLDQHWFNWFVNILIHILFAFKFLQIGVLFIDLYSFFCVVFCVFVTMSFIAKPTLKKHHFDDISNLFIETSINCF